MATRLEGKRVLLSAAGQGIGRASALAMAAEGADVFATDVNEETLASLLQEASGKLETFVLDVLDDTAVSDAARRTNPARVPGEPSGFPPARESGST